jgi:hypothetical protein
LFSDLVRELQTIRKGACEAWRIVLLSTCFLKFFLPFGTHDVVCKVKFATDFLPVLPEVINTWSRVRYLRV